MTNIFDLNNEYRKRQFKKGGATEADGVFLAQIDAINGIKSSPGYSAIKKYWELEYQQGLKDIININPKEIGLLAKAQAKLDLSSRFLYYLSSYER